MKYASAAALLLASATAAFGEPPATFTVEETRTFNASPEQIWRAWSEGSELKKWWGPHGFSVPVADMNFRVGEASLVCMQPEGGPKLCNTWRYTQLVPLTLIEFELGWADENGHEIDPTTIGLPPDIPRSVQHRVSISDQGNGRTAMKIEEFGYLSQETADISRGGLLQVLEKLEASLGT